MWVDTGEADDAVRSLRAIESESSPRTLAEHLGAEEEAHWNTTHSGCQEPSGAAYAIDVERIRSWPAYLHWCAHLMGKSWIEGTDWQEFVLRSLEPTLAAVSGVRPSKPQSLEWYGIGG